MNWNVIAVIIQFIETLVIIFALWYTWQQVRAMRQDIHLGAVWEIFKEMDNDELRSSRGYIYKNRKLYKAFEGEEVTSDILPGEAWKHAQRVSTTLDHLGYMVYKGLIPESIIWDGYRYIVVRNWMVLEPFIKFVRKTRQQDSYQAYFELLAMRIFKHDINREKILIAEEPSYLGKTNQLEINDKPIN